MSLASFTVYALMGNSLTSDVAFPALALFNLLRFPIMMFPIQVPELRQLQPPSMAAHPVWLIAVNYQLKLLSGFCRS